MHLDKDLQGKKAKKVFKPMETGVVKIIWLVKELVNTMKSKWVQMHALLTDYVNSQILGPVKDGLEFAPLGEASKIMSEITSNLNAIDFDLTEIEDQSLVKLIYVNWIRYQHILVNTNTQFAAYDQMSKLQILIGYISNRTETLKELASFKDLFYYQNELYDHLRVILGESDSMLRYSGVIGQIGADFGNLLRPSWPLELGWIQDHSSFFITESFFIIGYHAARIAHDISLQTIAIHTQTTAAVAIKYFHKKDTSKHAKDKSKKKVVQEISRPGFESSLVSGADAHMMKTKITLRYLVQALDVHQEIRVSSTDFIPLAFFLESLCSLFRGYMQVQVLNVPTSNFNVKDLPDPDDIQSFDIKRPSILWGEIKGYLSSLIFIESLIDIDCIGALRLVMLEQSDIVLAQQISSNFPDDLVYILKSRKGTIDRSKNNLKTMTGNLPILIQYVRWYGEFLALKAHTSSTIFSKSRGSFANLTMALTESEHFTDHDELVALCELLGVSGIQFLDEKLARMIISPLAAIEAFMLQNSDTLNSMKKIAIDWDVINKMPSNLS